MEENNGSPLIANHRIARGQLDNHNSAFGELDVQLSDVSRSETPPYLDVVDYEINQAVNNSVEYDTHSSSSWGSNADAEDIDLASPGPENFQDNMEPVDLDEAVSQGYPSLDFRFVTLKSWFLILSAALWLSILAGVAALAMIQLSQEGVLHVRQTGNYWALRFTPGIVGTITGIWWTAIAQSYVRLFPYFRMANPPDLQKNKVTDALLRNNIVDASFVVCRLLRGSHWTVFSVNITTLILSFFLVPFKSALLQITEDEAGWGITVSLEAAYTIMVLYTCLLWSTLAVLIQLWGKPTGLKWNPCSVASQLALIRGSNILKAFQGMEFPNWEDARELKWRWIKEYGCLRLGYWRDSQRLVEDQKLEQLWYGIRFIRFDERQTGKSPMRYYRLQQDVYGRKEAPITVLPESKAHWERPKPQSLVYHRYANGYANIFLNDIWISLCFLIGSASLVGLGLGLGTGVLSRPISYAGTHLENPLVRGMALSFFPGFILSLGNQALWSSDVYHRTMQPIRGMDKPHMAEHNILVDYISPNPLNIILDCLSRGYYRVAWGSLIAMNCTTGPIIAGKLFTVNQTSRTFQAAPMSAYTVLGILCLYVVALPFARVDPRYSASRGLMTIFDTVSLCYDSPMLEYPEFSVQRPDDGEIHLRSQVIVARRRYQFGYYLGLSGRRRLGFAEAGDVDAPTDSAGGSSSAVECLGLRMQAVDRIKMRYRFFRFSRMNGGWWFWRPRVVLGSTEMPRRRDTEMCVRTYGDYDNDEESDANSGSIGMLLMHGALQDGYATSEPGSERDTEMCVRTYGDDDDNDDGNDANSGSVGMFLMCGALQDGYATSEPGSERSLSCSDGHCRESEDGDDGDSGTSRSTAIWSIDFEHPSLARRGTLEHDWGE